MPKTYVSSTHKSNVYSAWDRLSEKPNEAVEQSFFRRSYGRVRLRSPLEKINSQVVQL